MYGLKSGDILLKARFKTADEAEAWGKENARGRGEYTVVPIADPTHHEFCDCQECQAAMGAALLGL